MTYLRATHFFRCAVVLFLAESGCYRGTARSFDPRELVEQSGWTFVRGISLIRQQSDRDCGAAALAMTLRYWNVPIELEDVLIATAPPTGHGIKAAALRDFARLRGLDAFLLSGELTDIQRELEKRRPVIVGLVKRFTVTAATHYEVVVGINTAQKRILTLDPSQGWRENTWEGFMTEWLPSHSLALIVFRKSPPRPLAGEGWAEGGELSSLFIDVFFCL